MYYYTIRAEYQVLTGSDLPDMTDRLLDTLLDEEEKGTIAAPVLSQSVNEKGPTVAITLCIDGIPDLGEAVTKADKVISLAMRHFLQLHEPVEFIGMQVQMMQREEAAALP